MRNNARPAALFRKKAQATTAPNLLPPPGKSLSLNVFTPASEGAGFPITHTDYRTVSYFTEVTWKRNPETGAYRAEDNFLTENIDAEMEFTPPAGAKDVSGVESLPKEKKSTLIFQDNGEILLTWLKIDAVKEILEEKQKEALLTIEKMARSIGDSAAKIMASDIITKPFMFPAVSKEYPEKEIKVILRDFNDFASIIEIAWHKDEDGTYSPKINYDPDMRMDMKFRPSPGQSGAADIPSTFIRLRNGDAFLCRAEKQDFETAIDLCHSECAATLAVFLRNIGYGEHHGLQPKPQEAPQPSSYARTCELDDI